jgi:Flp pilus assembly pilin Flp
MKKLKELYETLNARIAGIIQSEKGQTMIEYALVAVLIAIVLVFVFRSSGVNNGISAAASKINSALGSP